MSISYNFDLGVGFVLDKSEVLAPFAKNFPAKFHYEDRFDPKTGKKLTPTKVIDNEEGVVYELDGKEYDEEYELLEALAEKLRCNFGNGGGYSDCSTVYVAVELDTTGEDSYDDGRASCGSSATLENVIKSKKAVEVLAKKLRKLGIDPGVAKVYVKPDVG